MSPGWRVRNGVGRDNGRKIKEEEDGGGGANDEDEKMRAGV